MELILLGVGSPPPYPGASGHANGIEVGGQLFLIDAGRNVPRQIVSAGHTIDSVHHLLFTHFHSDHFTGFGDFYITRWLFGASETLHVFGPVPVEQHVERMLQYYEYDIEIRAEEGKPRAGLDLKTTVISRGDSLQIDCLKVYAEKCTNHGNVDDILSYRFEAEGRTIVIASDGSPNEKLVSFARDADVLMMHPCLPESIVEMLGQTEQMARIIAGHHATTEEIGRTATEANAKTVVLSHLTPPMAPKEKAIEEVAQFFDGQIIFGQDLMRI
ncbi:MAG: MBL fold metallo-hydrolase [Nitrospinae bacterium]|nr:MBL fold metallo-hydrolase [Nitrospinota bacterium]